jgi:hypothetical protein
MTTRDPPRTARPREQVCETPQDSEDLVMKQVAKEWTTHAGKFSPVGRRVGLNAAPPPKQATKGGSMMTDLASAPSKHSEQPRRYRERATAIRARLPTLQDDEVFTELYLLAAHYERLAEFAESSGSLGVFFRR